MTERLADIAPHALLGAGDPAPVEVINPDSDLPLVLVCEHAGQGIPARLGDLGLKPGEIDLHIGWDIGAEAVARRLADHLGAPLVVQRYSRLVIDCNRPPEAADSIPPVSDRVPVPANAALSAADRAARVAEIFTPFHAAVEQMVQAHPRRAAFAIHSFTPAMQGVARPWDIGFLFRNDTATSERLAAQIARMRPDWVIGMNQPYVVDDLSDFFVPRHGEARGLAHSLIEIRNDHLRDADGQALWAAVLAEAITNVMGEIA